ncbi:hypothetical protein LUZ61_012922 [Rhynchospora tenuis]|uniref:3'-5' exonuclease n=1 Tax=Rhynchospora tenuis TaxID=198213 RepID=A0AAD6F205_9POAL|nr:hypothetical protein LUZ61_012918 [Rhynchospora tenuis]KAJ3709217.1 hypothetical protein LUZ61_012922 [Rhynchospora tenuis]
MPIFMPTGSRLSGPSSLYRYRKLLFSFRPSLCTADWLPISSDVNISFQTHTPFSTLSEHIYSAEGGQGETENKLGSRSTDQSTDKEKISAWLYKMRDSTLEKIYAGHIPLHRSNFMMENDFIRDIAPTPRRVHLGPKFEVLKFGGRIAYCRTASKVEKATKELLNKIKSRKSTGQVPLGFDVEWKPSFQKGVTRGKTAVMQICLDTTCCYVMHIFHSGIPSVLKSLLEDSSSVKVGVGVQTDATKLVKDYDVNVQPLIDLSHLASKKLVGPTLQWGLSSLTETILRKQLDKQRNVRLGNWEAEVLSKKQLCYAAIDAFASWHLFEVLNSMPDVQTAKENSLECKKKNKRRDSFQVLNSMPDVQTAKENSLERKKKNKRRERKRKRDQSLAKQ